jgi:hypothetical protein
MTYRGAQKTVSWRYMGEYARRPAHKRFWAIRSVLSDKRTRTHLGPAGLLSSCWNLEPAAEEAAISKDLA